MAEVAPPGITWHSFDLKTGRRGIQLVTQEAPEFGRVIGEPNDLSGLGVNCYDTDRETSVDAVPTFAGAVPGWDAATLPGRTMLAALDENDTPIWGGVILRRHSTPSSWVGLDMSTLEAYLDRRYVRDHVYTNTAQGVIVDAILSADVIPTGVQFVVDADSPQVRDRTYDDDEDKTALAVLQELMGVEDGPEFTVDLEWADAAHTVLRRVVRVRDRIGTAYTQPATRFEMPGSVKDFEFTEDYTTENGANDLLATSSGEGDVRPVSDHAIATDLLANGWVRYESRFSPSTSIIDKNVLNDHARSELAEMRDGLKELVLTVDLDTSPRIGHDFHLGDDVTAVLTCPRFPQVLGPDGHMVPGYVKTVRCTGWDLDYSARTLSPRLLEVG